MRFQTNQWGLIIGGSSGLGLAAAKKLAAHGMNLCIVHRDRRSLMPQIESEFEKIKSTGVRLVTLNVNALTDEGKTRVLDTLAESLSETGRVRMLLHAVAFGNLKLLTSYPAPDTPQKTRDAIARTLGVSSEMLAEVVHKAFDNGCAPLHSVVDPPDFPTRQFLDHDDFARTIHAMGYDIVLWATALLNRKLFAKDARVIGLTSEGNSIAWRGYAAISAAKSVLESACRSMAVEFAPHGIRTNVVQAGVTDTAALRAIPGSTQIKARSLLRNPYGRLTTPEDVANVIYLLCLDEAAWINGAVIRADGGEKIA